jgi:TusA-related sulfurtransferase
LTWARTRYALSKLAAGAELKVIVDHRPAVPDIKRNTEEIGDEVLSSQETDPGVWEMVLRRCAR